MRPHSLETRILQVDQVDTVVLEPPGGVEPEAPFVDGQLGLGDLSPTAVTRLPRGSFFQDEDFPASSESLGFAEPPELRWRRPGELGVTGPLWTGDTSGRVRAGDFHDRWLAEAFAIVAQRPRLLDKVFGEPSPPDLRGVARVRLWRFGRWETVVVDDRLPTPHCIGTDGDAEVWPAVLEKAFAKVHGGYAFLAGGDVLHALEDLTGGVAQRLRVHFERPRRVTEDGEAEGAEPEPRPQERESLYTLVFRPLVQALRIGALVSCSPKRGQQQGESLDISVSTLTDTKLTIRGPQVCVHDDSGSSAPRWLDLEDFVKTYTNIIVTTLSTGSDKLQVQEVFGFWEAGINAGGSRNNLEKFAINPQYSLTINQPEKNEDNRDFGRCSLLLALMQEHRKSNKDNKPPVLPIACFIYKADVPEERLSAEYFLCVPEEVATGPFRNKREVAHQAELEPGNYIVIPAAWSALHQGGFLLRIITLRKIKLTALTPYQPMCAMLPTWVPATEI
ncbi:calpain-A [Frankliniella occidentalis]|uniref:Calpain-A n=1 Tax=Frankliniella occidentalis TaxID=133901 RepID=A0A9C6UA66_FRAOC|nr:calpain-A [Frankliniella occidentalis]